MKKKIAKKTNYKIIVLISLIVALGFTSYFTIFAGVSRKVGIGAYTYWYGILNSNYEVPMDRKFDSFLWYASIDQSFDKNFGENLKKDNKKLQLAWEPSFVGNDFNASDYTLKKISQGYHDDDIKRWAKELKEYGGVVYFRPMSEMNGNWSTWSGTTNNNKPEDYIPAWIHIKEIFTKEKATNVLFVWAVNHKSVPYTKTNAMKVYYPGNQHVDIIGLNGYNFGEPDISFEEIFKNSYNESIKLSKGKKPIIIAETGCYNSPNKPKWIDNMSKTLKNKFKRVTQVYWFNADKEKEWSIDHPKEALNSFINMMDNLRPIINPKLKK